MKKTKKAIIVFLSLLLISFLFIGFSNLSSIKYILRKSSYQKLELTDFSSCEANDLIVSDGKILINGPDPYIYIYNGSININSLSISFNPKATNRLTVYYNTGKGFNEADKLDITLNNQSTINSLSMNKIITGLRLDFENVAEDSPNEIIENIPTVTINPDNSSQVRNDILIKILWAVILSIISTVGLILLARCTKLSELVCKICFSGFVNIMTILMFTAFKTHIDIIILSVIIYILSLALIDLYMFTGEYEEGYLLFNRISKKKLETTLEFIFIAVCGCIFTIWMVLIPFNCAPDEYMRYVIPKYIVNHHSLPRGDAPEILDPTWGFSYAFTPILSYIISAIFMQITSIFTNNETALLMSSRLVSVLFSMGAVYFVIKTAKKLFNRLYAALFIILFSFLPQFIFISSYLNCDAIAIFSASWIIYALIYGDENSWSIKSTVFLGAAIGLAIQTYYNVYGIVLLAIIYCIVSVIRNKKIDRKLSFIMSRAGIVALCCIAISGWWFIRNAVLYNGDFLGITASRNCGEAHALPGYMPSERNTVAQQGLSLKYMLFDMQWLRISIQSFVGQFGYMSVLLKKIQYHIMYLILAVGCIGNVLIFIPHRKKEEKKALNQFFIFMILMCAITCMISIYYSYNNDFQAQGRYVLPMLISFMFLIANGIRLLIQWFPQKIQHIIVYSITIIYMTVSVTALTSVLAPLYA